MRGLGTHQILQELNGSPQYVETVAATTSSGTSTLLRAGDRLMLQSDAAVFLKPGASGVVAVVAQGVGLDPGEKYFLCLQGGPAASATEDRIAFITASGTANVKIFRLV